MKPSNRDALLVYVRLAAWIENLPGFIQPVMAAAEALAIGAEKRNDIELVVEEAVINIVTHAYPQTAGYVKLTCRMERNQFIVTLEDEGIPFPVPDAEAPDISSDLPDRKVGGLGIHLMKSLTDGIRYHREDGRNRLELAFSIQTGKEKK